MLALHLVLVLPDRPGPASWTAWFRLPVELPIVVLALLSWPQRRWPLLQWSAAAGLGLLVGLAFADMATQAGLGRNFHPMLDLHLAGASFELLVAALGPAGAAALAAATLLAWVLSVIVLYRAVGALRPSPRLRGRLVATAAVSTFVFGGIHLAAVHGRLPTLTTAATSVSVGEHLLSIRHSLTDRARFGAELADDTWANVPADRLLARLRGIDVLFVFVESYGHSTLELQPYASTVQQALADFEDAVEAVGYGVRSAWLTAPIHGGQSWLAHATLLSGLRIDDQRRYESLVVSERQTLVADFRRAGWRTLAVLPATRRAWPEGRFYGFDRVYAAKDLGYAGESFDWITMPDQYTLSALDRLELDRRDRPPIMATVALISSHAPWTPLPPLFDWEAMGDGAVFTRELRSGDAPAVVWLDPERVRAQYLRSIGYVLRTIQSWLVRRGRDNELFVVVGDHQPARIISGDDTSFEVPIHLLARDSRLLDAIAAPDWSRGMRPDPDAPTWPMEAIRGRFLEVFTVPAL